MTLPVLLVGAAALALAARLRLSGYRPLRLAADGFSLVEGEDGVVGENGVDWAPSDAALADGAVAGSGVAERGLADGAVEEGGGSVLEAGGDDGGPVPGISGAAAAGLEPTGGAVSRSRRSSPQPTAAEVPAAVDPAITLVAVVLSPDQDALIPSLRHRWGAVPILLGSDDDSVEGRSRTLLSGADDFWLTGLGPSDLLTRLRLHRQLLPSLVPGPERLQLADLQVIPASRQVSRGGRSLALTAREYQLLLLLLEHRGRVLSREEILRQVWQDQQGSASNVIDVYVRYLRQKLELGGERRLIHTVRGRGYCLSEGPPPSEPS